MPGDGKSLEQLIYSLERALGHDDNVSVESPKRVPDKITGKKREHDVLITIKQGHHQVQVAIECRDRSRPITVNQIEGFWKKCQDTGIDKGVLVSTMGFYNTARKKADFLDIRCLDVEEVDSFDWMLAPGVHSIIKKLLHHEWTFYPELDGIAEKGNMEISDNHGNILSPESMTSNALTQLNKLLPEIPEPVEKESFVVKFPGDNLVLTNSETGDSCPVKFVIVEIFYSVINEIIPFKLVQYKEGDENITDAAIANLSFDDNAGNLMVVEEKGGGKRVLYVPDKKA